MTTSELIETIIKKWNQESIEFTEKPRAVRNCEILESMRFDEL